MGIFKFIKSQFIEVIEWTDDSRDIMVYRFPVQGKEIKMGAQLTVRESQMAIFVNEGEITDIFPPGRYTLSTENLPVLCKLKAWKYGFNSPFKSEVYFVNTRQFTDNKWGTSNPIMMRDKDFGVIRIRGYGIYSFRVSSPEVFLKEVFGTNSSFDTENIEGQLKRMIISGLTDAIGESKVAALDLLMYYDELSEITTNKLQSKFNDLGITLTSLYIENISVPDEVEEAMNKRASVGAMSMGGGIDNYTRLQAADAMRDAAQNEGNIMANAGIGLSTGAALGNIMAQTLNNVNSQNKSESISHSPVEIDKKTQEMITCSGCKEKISKDNKFCPECGTKTLVPEENMMNCSKCGAKIKIGSKFCPECGEKQNKEKFCEGCGAKLSDSSKFCPECGTKA
ncbi:SPFH domain-containing protein [Oceanirhabdus sp. W0125-5]|uniref:SPFH domain-containing protein n=1 Tax=Oceanirhabdus sp. W0125-5 TaxID=2999116 RepID=UPI0022F30389|nr:SPFH domain-containing protein [Oceanirhabdus sp. W0125-5]WBW95154.1 SPFH domain-containing protein [Oceanirhabdus sp. W0125-5]